MIFSPMGVMQNIYVACTSKRMKELTTRAISDTICSILTITMFISLAFYCLIAIFAGLALWEFQQLIKFENIIAPLLLAGLFALALSSPYTKLYFDSFSISIVDQYCNHPALP